MGKEFDKTSEQMLDKLKDKIKYEHWYFGHYHKDKHFYDNEGTYCCLYEGWEEIR